MKRPQHFQWTNNPEPQQTVGSDYSDSSLKNDHRFSEHPRKKMQLRMHIRDQLCLLILITNLLALMVLAVSTWYQSVHHLRQAKWQTLMVTANLKATQVAQEISLFRTSVQQISTRSIIQNLMQDFNNGNHSQELYDSIKVRSRGARLLD
jgi:hypothetical protein